MKAGRMDRRITIEEIVESRDSYGAVIKTWALFATVWAEVRPVRSRELIASAKVTAEFDTVFRCRWLDGVLPSMRVVHDGAAYDVTGIAEIGRRDGLEIMGRRHV